MILTFHTQSLPGGKNGGSVMLPAYYLEEEYSITALHIHADKAPGRVAKFGVYQDGVSIVSNKTIRTWNQLTGVENTGADDKTVELSADTNSEEYIDDLNSETIGGGTWITCTCEDSGDGKDFTVVLDVSPVDETQD